MMRICEICSTILGVAHSIIHINHFNPHWLYTHPPNLRRNIPCEIFNPQSYIFVYVCVCVYETDTRSTKFKGDEGKNRSLLWLRV